MICNTPQVDIVPDKSDIARCSTCHELRWKHKGGHGRNTFDGRHVCDKGQLDVTPHVLRKDQCCDCMCPIVWHKQSEGLTRDDLPPGVKEKIEERFFQVPLSPQIEFRLVQRIIDFSNEMKLSPENHAKLSALSNQLYEFGRHSGYLHGREDMSREVESAVREMSDKLDLELRRGW